MKTQNTMAILKATLCLLVIIAGFALLCWGMTFTWFAYTFGIISGIVIFGGLGHVLYLYFKYERNG